MAGFHHKHCNCFSAYSFYLICPKMLLDFYQMPLEALKGLYFYISFLHICKDASILIWKRRTCACNLDYLGIYWLIFHSFFYRYTKLVTWFRKPRSLYNSLFMKFWDWVSFYYFRRLGCIFIKKGIKWVNSWITIFKVRLKKSFYYIFTFTTIYILYI